MSTDDEGPQAGRRELTATLDISDAGHCGRGHVRVTADQGWLESEDTVARQRCTHRLQVVDRGIGYVHPCIPVDLEVDKARCGDPRATARHPDGHDQAVVDGHVPGDQGPVDKSGGDAEALCTTERQKRGPV